jgi:hypothetical protein
MRRTPMRTVEQGSKLRPLKMGPTVRSAFLHPTFFMKLISGVRFTNRQVDGQGSEDHHQAALGDYYYIL